jgi:hypothetical protein
MDKIIDTKIFVSVLITVRFFDSSSKVLNAGGLMISIDG